MVLMKVGSIDTAALALPVRNLLCTLTSIIEQCDMTVQSITSYSEAVDRCNRVSARGANIQGGGLPDTAVHLWSSSSSSSSLELTAHVNN